MPTITYHRFWCKHCNDWTLFHRASFSDTTMNCNVCNYPQERVMSSDIPREKILEQRKRYKESETKSLFSSGLIGAFFNPRPDNLFSEKYPEPEIVEHDAGQKAIDKEGRERRMKEYEHEKKEQAELQAKFGNLRRNDKCGCGSGKKFKKCCQLKMTY